jgi:hypothetical protein
MAFNNFDIHVFHFSDSNFAGRIQSIFYVLVRFDGWFVEERGSHTISSHCELAIHRWRPSRSWAKVPSTPHRFYIDARRNSWFQTDRSLHRSQSTCMALPSGSPCSVQTVPVSRLPLRSRHPKELQQRSSGDRLDSPWTSSLRYLYVRATLEYKVGRRYVVSSSADHTSSQTP